MTILKNDGDYAPKGDSLAKARKRLLNARPLSKQAKDWMAAGQYAEALACLRAWLGIVLSSQAIRINGCDDYQLTNEQLFRLCSADSFSPEIIFPNHTPEEQFLYRMLTQQGLNEPAFPQALQTLYDRIEKMQQDLWGRLND